MRVANAALELAQCSIVSETYEAVYEAVQMGEGAVLLDMCIGVCYVFCCTVYCTRCRLGLCQSCSSGRRGPGLSAAVLTILLFMLHTLFRGLTQALKAPQLGSRSGWTGQPTEGSRLDDPRPSGPPARPSPASGAHRGGTTVSAASSPASPCCCLVLPFGSHQSQLPWQLLIASCHAWGAA